MQLLPLSFFRWWEASWIASFVNTAQWYFAIIETIHIMAFTILLGTIFIVNLRLLGFGLRRQSTAQVARYLKPYTWGSLLIVATTGGVLFASEAVRLGGSQPFLWKIDILGLAVLIHIFINKKLTANAVAEESPWMKVAACVSLVCWFGVGLAGRAIAFL
jgi:hypothetical protein